MTRGPSFIALACVVALFGACGHSSSSSSTTTTIPFGLGATVPDDTAGDVSTTTLATTGQLAATTTRPARKRPSTATTSGCKPPSDRNAKTTNGTGKAVLQGVTMFPFQCYEVAMFKMRDTQVSGLKVSLAVTSPPFTDPGGHPVTVKGNSYLKLVMTGVTGYDPATKQKVYKGKVTVDAPPNVHHIVELRETGDNGTMTWIIGLDAARAFAIRIVENPVRVFVDVA